MNYYYLKYSDDFDFECSYFYLIKKKGCIAEKNHFLINDIKHSNFLIIKYNFFDMIIS